MHESVGFRESEIVLESGAQRTQCRHLETGPRAPAVPIAGFDRLGECGRTRAGDPMDIHVGVFGEGDLPVECVVLFEIQLDRYRGGGRRDNRSERGN